MDDHHLSNITKFLKSKKRKKEEKINLA